MGVKRHNNVRPTNVVYVTCNNVRMCSPGLRLHVTPCQASAYPGFLSMNRGGVIKDWAQGKLTLSINTTVLVKNMFTHMPWC